MLSPLTYGLFFNDTPEENRRLRNQLPSWGRPPAIPETGWKPVTEFPNLSAAKVVGFDVETYDPELKDAGPGWGRGKGHIVGASLAVEDGSSWYFPFRHGIFEDKQYLPAEHAALNMNPEKALAYLDHVLNNDRPKVGANVVYDVGWLAWEGVTVGGKIYDVQFAEALLDSEAPNVSLEKLAENYTGAGKVSSALYEWLAQWNSKPANDNQRAFIYASPPALAGPYAEADASLPIQILNKQWPAMAGRGVLDLFDLECRLVPLLVKMRLKGVPVNIKEAQRVYDDFSVRLKTLDERLTSFTGKEVNPNSADSLAKVFQHLSLPIPKHVSKATGKESVTFEKEAIAKIDHPFVDNVLEHRQLSKVRDTFIQSYIMDKSVNSRVYCNFNPLKSDKGGTRSGRFSSSAPNLQNIPVRSDEGKLVRTIFSGVLEGNRWRSFDYSSIEYRLLAHYAVGSGADAVRNVYAEDPAADYHKIVGDLIRRLTGQELQRGKIKTINFGIIYGMALNALAKALGLEKSEASNLLDNYHKAAPYARQTMDMCAAEVHEAGTVRTILGRVSDFNAWGSKKWQEGGRESYDYETAARKFGISNIERQLTHKALNRKLQGSAADVMKKAMVDAYEAGLFDENACGVPVLTVHDELDFEDKGDVDNPAWIELKRVMETGLVDKLRVPLLVEGGYGDTWADAH